MLLIWAIELSLVLQLTVPVQGRVVLSLKLQVAVSGSRVVPAGTELKGAVTVSEVRIAAVTLAVVDPLMPLRNAVIEVLPTVRPVSNPWVPGTLLTCAIVLSSWLQLT